VRKVRQTCRTKFGMYYCGGGRSVQVYLLSGWDGFMGGGSKEDVKDSIRKVSLAIIQVVVGYGFCVEVESLNCVKIGSFFFFFFFWGFFLFIFFYIIKIKI